MAKELTLVAVRAVGPTTTTTASPTKWSPTVAPLRKRTIRSLPKLPNWWRWKMSRLLSQVASLRRTSSGTTSADGLSHTISWANSSSWECSSNIKCRVTVAVMRIQALSVPAYRPAIPTCPSYPSTMLKSSFRSSTSRIKMEQVAPPTICTRNSTWAKRTTIWPWRARMQVEWSLPSSRRTIWRRTLRPPWNEKRALTAAIVESIRWLIHQN